MARLSAAGLADRCRQVACRPATREELLAVHQEALLAEVESGSARLGTAGRHRTGCRARPPNRAARPRPLRRRPGGPAQPTAGRAE
jgi:acetoin utilization deacetylase AcuC-like enzyme